MNYSLYLPRVGVRRHVKYFWSLDRSDSEILPPVYKSMADGYTEIVFSINGSFKEYYNYGGYVLPQHTNHRTLTIGDNIGLFGARLYPQSIFSILGLAGRELVNGVHNIYDILPRDLVTEISEAGSHLERVSLFSNYLLRKNHQTSAFVEQGVQAILETHGMGSVDRLAKFLSVSERQLERKFNESIGLSPKQYSRIIRFQYAKRRFVENKYSFAQLAFDCNYSDQPHFARDFKEFSGMTISEFSTLVNKPGSEEARVIKGLLLAKDEPYRL